MNKLIKIGFLGAFIFFSMLGSVYAQNLEDQLIGAWEFTSNKYKRVKKLAVATPGIEFKENGTVLVRKDISWCSQAFYDDFEGTWKRIDDSKLKIKIRMGYPKGIVIRSKKYRLKYLIEQLTHHELMLTKI